MKNIIYFLMILFTSNFAQQSGSNVLQGPYIGQTPPGDTPELFAPGIVGDIFAEHSAAAFTPDGKEVFWTRTINQGQRPRLVVAMHMKQVDGVWTQPELAPFSDGFLTFVEYISKDGKQLYFTSNRNKDNKEESVRQTRNWVVNRTNSGWDLPRLFILSPNWKQEYKWPKKVKNGNLYVRRKLKETDRTSSLFRSKLVEGEYQEPVLLDESINSEYLDYAFYIDQDEEFIIFASNRPGGFIDGIELYISYLLPDETWSEAKNLGEKINSLGLGGSDWPYLSPDKKYLFFTTSLQPYNDYEEKQYSFSDLKEIYLSNENGYSKMYWVKADFLDELKPDELK